MNVFVLDAGVAVKWALREKAEPLVPEASGLLDRLANQAVGLVASELFWSELTHVLVKAVRRKLTGPEQGNLVLRAVMNLTSNP